MDYAASFTLSAGLLAAFGAAVAWRLSRAPLWADLRRFALVSGFTAAFVLLDVVRQQPLPTGILDAASHLLGASAILIAWSWLGYSDLVCRRSPGTIERRVRAAMPLVAVLVLLPGVAFESGLAPGVPGAAIGWSWYHAPLTRLGIALALALVAAEVLVLVRLLLSWRAGSPGAGGIALGYAILIPVTCSDVLIQAGRIPGPHLLGLALALPLLAAAWFVGRQFVDDANALKDLRDRLEGLVEERTRDLAESNAALLQAEKLAALGQFAAGVGHEVNNPASVVTANLTHLARELARGMDEQEAQEILDESVDAMHRINDLVRKLLDAGRLADLPSGAGNVTVAEAAASAVDAVRLRTRADVAVESRVPDDLLVRGGGEVLASILAALLANAVEAIPQGRKGRVEVTARADGANVLTIIEDDGAGMRADVLRRAFDPFFTTKQVGRGSGLGLPITRGLVEGIGGQIWLESEPGKGTRAVVELPAGRPS